MANSGLKNKGIELLKATNNNIDKITEICKKEADKSLKFGTKLGKEMQKEQMVQQIKEGVNAFYSPITKTILIPEKNMRLTVFHEMGHAMNDNFGKLSKIFMRNRKLSSLLMPISAIAIFKTKKATGEKSDNPIGKATDFIKNNAGKLSFLTFIPVLADEGLASIKGQKFAKKVLSSELANKASKANLYGFMTYLSLAIASSIGVTLGVKVKDAIAKPKYIEPS